MNVPLPFQGWYAVVFWLVYLWAGWPEVVLTWQSRELARRPQDAGTLYALMTSQAAALLLAFSVAFLPVPALRLPHSEALFATGIVVAIAGSLARRHCFRMLGRYFKVAIAVDPDQALVERGLYRWVRHPSYTAGMALFLGVGCCLANIASMAFVTVIPMLAFARRVQVEERVLVETLGDPYLEYMRRTWRYIPYLV